MANVRNRVGSWVARRYVARVRRKGFDLATIRFLPDSTLTPLRRHGVDPVPELDRLRQTSPISKVPLPVSFDVWLVTGYEEAKSVLAAPTAFSNEISNLAGRLDIPEGWTPGGLGFSDPPVHTQRRKMLTPEFTMRRLSRLNPRIAAIVDQQLDEMADAAVDGRPVDLMEHFALPIPMLMICELLGVREGDRADFQRLASARFDLFAGAYASTAAISESMAFLMDIVRKQRDDPGDGLIGGLIRQHGDAIDDVELAGLCDGVLTGGLETTASMLALGSIMLLRDRDQFARIRDDESAIGPFVEEMLRHLSVVQLAFPRFAREDIEIAGTRIARGDVVLVSLSGANRDPKISGCPHADMNTFDPSRETSSHLAFGWGMHRCIGAELAKMELRAAFSALVRRYPDLHLAVPERELSYRKLSIVYGVDSVPVYLR
ncbi:Cytochrome P450 FAS1 [Actinomadura rubteroloni]|uniref:Cytochrome P450 FAS1 n=1 Tax=Actinomadura rubteroloni TaxID=1926885 RepID=A0A2P4UPU7_9ACTN|nr:cytochrome P450 [Actinomadura rubteroloni]POM27077.1 Cytochrome P450 FAS1 [Actinomadura rubteroloni]